MKTQKKELNYYTNDTEFPETKVITFIKAKDLHSSIFSLSTNKYLQEMQTRKFQYFQK
jgi:hypothetical protein